MIQKLKHLKSSFFELVFDSSLSDYTYFSEPIAENGEVVDWWHFSARGRWTRSEALTVTANPIGRLYDMSMAPGDVPYVTQRVVDLFDADEILSDAIQFIPLKYGVHTIYIMNILPIVKCVDDEKTESILRWGIEDDEPERIGQYQQIIGLRVLPENLKGVDICRVKDWDICIIVSQRVKVMLESHKVKGVEFWPV